MDISNMLEQLKITNYALIEQTEIHFTEGFTVITGETGAGKSILLGALGLLLGNRADTSTLYDKTKKCIVEAVYNLKKHGLSSFFESNELDYEPKTIVRREITIDGKSRAFINDTPVNLSVLKQLGEYLMDIHSQHETLLLNETNFQFGLLDAFAKTGDVAQVYKSNYLDLQKKKKELDLLLQQEQQAKKDLDYYQFQFDELNGIELQSGELVSLENESVALENAESIKESLTRAATAITNGEESAVTSLAAAKQVLQSLTRYGASYEELYARLNSIYIELKELGNDIERTESDVVFDAPKLELINARLDGINRLLKKHNATNEDELLIVKNSVEEKLLSFSSLSSTIEKLSKTIGSLEKDVTKQAKALSDKRHAVIADIEKNIKAMLADLAMPHAQFKIVLQPLKELGVNGLDGISFLFTANKGGDFKELHKVASGGELSRLMLCLKAQLAELKSLPTIVFDEIDTGVSGDVADKIATILTSMGKFMQVITITHLPQLASKGSNHLFVYKTDTKEKTVSNIKSLTKDERVSEIAKMLSTGTPTEAAIKNAKDLLNFAQ